jgi:Domain of unknown function (DUF927)
MPMDMLGGSCEELRSELLNMGAIIDPRVRHLLAQYLLSVHPKKTILCTTQVGWCGDSFVLPDVVIGESASKVIFQSGHHMQAEYTRAGALNAWREEISKRAIGNPVLMLALSAAFRALTALTLTKRCTLPALILVRRRVFPTTRSLEMERALRARRLKVGRASPARSLGMGHALTGQLSEALLSGKPGLKNKSCNIGNGYRSGMMSMRCEKR